MENVYLRSVELRDIGKFPHLQFEAGALTILSGQNAEGKSTVLQAIADVFEGGHDPAKIRDWGKPKAAEKGEVILTLSDGTLIRKVITDKGSELSVRTKEGGVVKAPAAYLQSLATSFAFDPLALMDCPAKERTKFISEAMPTVFDAKEVNEALGVESQVKALDLAGLEQLRLGKYEDRKGRNATVKQLEGAIAESRQAVGEESEKDWAKELDAIKAEMDALAANLGHAKASIDLQAVESKSEATKKAAEEIQAIKDRLAAELEEISREARDVFEAGAAESRGKIDKLREASGTIQAKADQQKRNAGLRAGIERMTEECRKATFESERLSKQIEALDKLKLAKLAVLPIPGLEVRNGDAYIDGVVWRKCNTGERIKLSIAIAALKLGRMPLLVTDRMESVDENNMGLLKEYLKAAGIQMIGAVVTSDQALTIQKGDAAA